ncbi:energy transducer TonB [Tropicimonas sp. TH_r6]|uniref:energy transducer TonB n=1 Tax=Tropicimonas sp. TH_r6 TaxID=3082085 RepID=UPI0029547D79|nr:energy transducer TonB [Tropicimonas sp. TH_r6]MDV7145186.1 energy transducer TonB [Tropicimonas sp. TH_r6]
MASWFHMNTGVKISGAAHLGLILWMAIGGIFSFEDSPPMEVAEVSVISSEQFEAMMAVGREAPDVAEAPASPAAPEPPEATETPDIPAPEPAPEATEPPEPSDPVAPEPEPEAAEPLDVPQAEVAPVAPPTPARPELPDGASTTVAPENPPAPDAAPRVAPRPADRPDPDANVAEEVQEAARREEAPEAPPVPEAPEETTAPEETGTVVETEATEEAGGTAVTELAPAGAPRPVRRPDRPRPSPPDPEPSPARDPLADAIAGAVAEAVAETPPVPARASGGPQLSYGEKEALKLAVSACWSVGSLSTDAMRTTVTVLVEMQEDGRPVTIHLLDFEGGTEAAARQAFEAARRAILRCGARGYDLPRDKYERWREMELVFNPEKMRAR